MADGYPRLSESFLGELRGRVTVFDLAARRVEWDRSRSNPGRDDWWALCPFHGERTPSFHVTRKNRWHCFGCGRGGDMFDFAMLDRNTDFMGAVRFLAWEAGLEMPAPDAKASVAAAVRGELRAACAEATAFFRMRLDSPEATGARKWLESRGVSGEEVDRWEIGFAPFGGGALLAHLRGKGVDDRAAIAAGLVRDAVDGRPRRDFFVGRIMFPVHDRLGRPSGFIGRGRKGRGPKYLNSPGTAVFDKGRTLFNHARARAAVAPEGPLLVAEGVMDVIALERAGWPAAVAPLGTAVTSSHLDMLWDIHHEPVAMMDGDDAGRLAGLRLADLALPRLEPGRSLLVAELPKGADPDTLVRRGEADEIRVALVSPGTVLGRLWDREAARHRVNSPDSRAAIRAALRERVAVIGDRGLRAEYERDIDGMVAAQRPVRLDAATLERVRGQLKPGQTVEQFVAWAMRGMMRMEDERAAGVDTGRVGRMMRDGPPDAEGNDPLDRF